MHEGFWRDRWQKGLTGFHEGTANAFLRAHADEWLGDRAGKVLVPLCGKTADLGFLADRGLDVVGVELVRSAAEAFFRESGLEPAVEPWHGFESLRGGRVRIAVGNFFGLALPEADRFPFAYDRAALVAMRPEDRERYVATLLGALGAGARILLVSFTFEGVKLENPPFSVDAPEVHRLFSSCRVELLGEKDLTESDPRFKERGATRVLEGAWLVTTG